MVTAASPASTKMARAASMIFSAALTRHPLEGTRVPTADLSTLSTITEGTGRIVVQRTSDPLGAVEVAYASFFDTESQQPCDPALESDWLQCHARGLPSVTDYADDARTPTPVTR
jgi:hypothetical protein